jgi:hypothetical protein
VMPNNIILDEATAISPEQWTEIIRNYNTQREEYRRLRELNIQSEEAARRLRNSYMYQSFTAGIGGAQQGYNQVYYGVGGAGGYGEWRQSESKPKAKKESKIPWL